MAKKKQAPSQQAALFAPDLLPMQQSTVLRAMRNGANVEEAAKIAEVEAETVRAWLRLDPSFAQSWEEIQREEEIALRNKARSTAKEGLTTLVEVMQAELEETDETAIPADVLISVIQAKAKAQKELLQAKVKAAQVALSIIPKSVWGEEQTKPTEEQKQGKDAQTSSTPSTDPHQEPTRENDPVLSRWREQRSRGDC